VDHLERVHGAEVVLASSDLAHRAKLRHEVAMAADDADVFVTEIKAAAIDVVAEGAALAHKPVVFCDNEVVPTQGHDLDALVDRLVGTAAERFAAVCVGTGCP
jgi:cyclic 2,3-diphosphoglycerate synthase